MLVEYFYIVVIIAVCILIYLGILLVKHIFHEIKFIQFRAHNFDLVQLIEEKDPSKLQLTLVFLMCKMIYDKNKKDGAKRFLLDTYTRRAIPDIKTKKLAKELINEMLYVIHDRRASIYEDVCYIKHEFIGYKNTAKEFEKYLSEEQKLYIAYLLTRIAFEGGKVGETVEDALTVITADCFKIPQYILDDLREAALKENLEDWYQQHISIQGEENDMHFFNIFSGNENTAEEMPTSNIEWIKKFCLVGMFSITIPLATMAGDPILCFHFSLPIIFFLALKYSKKKPNVEKYILTTNNRNNEQLMNNRFICFISVFLFFAIFLFWMKFWVCASETIYAFDAESQTVCLKIKDYDANLDELTYVEPSKKELSHLKWYKSIEPSVTNQKAIKFLYKVSCSSPEEHNIDIKYHYQDSEQKKDIIQEYQNKEIDSVNGFFYKDKKGTYTFRVGAPCSKE